MSSPGPVRPSAHGPGLRILPWIVSSGLLALPAVAMWRGVPGVRWTAGDFVAAAVLLVVASALFDVALRRDTRAAWRAGAAVAIATGLATAWVNLAVGMFGDPGDPRNLLFGGVLLVALAGAWRSRWRAAGLARAMLAAAVAQVAAAGIGWLTGAPVHGANPPPAMEAGLVAAFALPWLLAACLFLRADRLSAGRGRGGSGPRTATRTASSGRG